MSVKEHILHLHKTLANNVHLVAVSKTKPNELILEAYNAGQRIFGENKVQELVEKEESLPKDIEWHMIGHLQTNKVKYIAPFVRLIHAVDSIKLIKEINKRAKQNNRIIPCLLQVHIAQEENKFGLDKNGVIEILNCEFPNVSIKGLMGMATFTEDKNQIREEFKYLKNIYDEIKESQTTFSILSMGMSGDYSIAIEEGSNMVRIGSSIFGNR
ncbi:MAG: YggS family pyridoxal phosphate-dependent enzyme [Flavobacteriales bacterium]|nr:YggS family pyridoxal phosphate-dependent enzyme [Flavobacteriales bacterium]MBL6873058.1 YggS family pyridoxal phosphate-dependent enzyme [Flavobacteriales bacterium]